MTPFVAVPIEAIDRRRELTAGAFELFMIYCQHRNRDTLQCNPSRPTIASEMGCTETHVSDLKKELVSKGWIRKSGRRQVFLIVGSFAPSRVQMLRPECRNIPTLENPKSEKSDFECRNIPTLDADIIRNEQRREPRTAAAPTPAAGAWKSQPIEPAFIDELIADKIYSEQMIRHVAAKLVAYCRKEGTTPTKSRLTNWLAREREEPNAQQRLPTIDNDPVAVHFGQPKRKNADPNCQQCFGSGTEVVAGRGARPCKCRELERETG